MHILLAYSFTQGIEYSDIQQQRRIVDAYQSNSGPESETKIPKHVQNFLIFARK